MDQEKDMPKDSDTQPLESASRTSFEEKRRRIEGEMESRIRAYTEESASAVKEIEQSIEEARQDLSRFKDRIVLLDERERSVRSQTGRVLALVADNKKKMADLARQSLEEISRVEELRIAAEGLLTEQNMEVFRSLKGIADKYGLSADWEIGLEKTAEERDMAVLKENMTAVLKALDEGEDRREDGAPVARPGEDEEPGTRPAAGISEAAEERLSVLVVEDDPIAARILEHFLETRHGLRVETVSDAGRAQKALEERPDLLMVNIAFPEMDIKTFMARAVKGDPPVPTIALGAYDERPALREAVEKGASGFLTKPISVDELMKIVEDIVNPGEDGAPRPD
jgi:CheY-like chemotaxis protein